MKHLAILCAFLFAGCATMNSHPHVDHIMLGIADLDRGIRELESLTGVRAVYGGEHPHLGTHNALISLGPETYLEVIAPRAGTTVSPDLADLAKLEHLTPVGWAVSMPDVAALRARLAKSGIKTTEPRPGSRKTPSGAVLQWETAGIDSPLDNAPFFIRWSDPQLHPAKTSPAGCTLLGIELDDPNAAELTRIDQALGFNFPIHNTTKPAMRVTLRCGERTIHFPNANP
jgi:hypothetical protein